MAKKNSGSTFNGKPIFSSGVKEGAPSSPSNISGDSGSFLKNTMSQALQPRKEEYPFSMTQSFDKLIGGCQSSVNKSIGSFGGGRMMPSMNELEAASMRLADAASKRGLAEKQAEAEMEARMSGYESIEDMMKKMRRKRISSQYQY